VAGGFDGAGSDAACVADDEAAAAGWRCDARAGFAGSAPPDSTAGVRALDRVAGVGGAVDVTVAVVDGTFADVFAGTLAGALVEALVTAGSAGLDSSSLSGCCDGWRDRTGR
jgi:hypothetical protein